MVEYGRIHTDGSRSGGQPVLLPCPVPWCNSLNVSSKVFEAKRKKHWLQCNDCGFLTPQMTSRAKAENIWNTRQPTQSDALREALERIEAATRNEVRAGDRGYISRYGINGIACAAMQEQGK